MQKLSDKEKERYSRHFLIDGFEETHQIKLKNAKVLIIGTGGLGSPVTLYLTAAGVGTIGIVDNDTVTLSNLQRQVLFSEKDIGKSKIDIAKQRLQGLNSNTKINSYNIRFAKENAVTIAKNYDLIIDCTDNFETRYLIDETCKKLNIPFVYGAIKGFSGQVSVFNYKTKYSYRDLFPEIPENSGDVPGVIGTTPAIVGSIQSAEAIKIITGTGETLDGKLLVIDSKYNSFEILRLIK